MGCNRGSADATNQLWWRKCQQCSVTRSLLFRFIALTALFTPFLILFIVSKWVDPITLNLLEPWVLEPWENSLVSWLFIINLFLLFLVRFSASRPCHNPFPGLVSSSIFLLYHELYYLYVIWKMSSVMTCIFEHKQ